MKLQFHCHVIFLTALLIKIRIFNIKIFFCQKLQVYIFSVSYIVIEICKLCSFLNYNHAKQKIMRHFTNYHFYSSHLDPCLKQNGGCAHTCVADSSKVSGRRCECQAGYKLKSDTACTDVNECETAGVCSQICTNTKGSYKCDCISGYELVKNRFCKALKRKFDLLLCECI